MRRGKIVLISVLVMLFMGVTAAVGALGVKIHTNSGSYASADGTINVPEGLDVYNSVGLVLNFDGEPRISAFSVYDKNNVLVGSYRTCGERFVPIHWIVPTEQIKDGQWVGSFDDTQIYTVIATVRYYSTIPGIDTIETSTVKLKAFREPVPPAPELSTVVLMSAGMIGLFGLVRTQRRE